jgi:hypothetical protein
MRVLGRRTERLVDTVLERLRKSMLESVGFGVDYIESEVERPRQVKLEQTVRVRRTPW